MDGGFVWWRAWSLDPRVLLGTGAYTAAYLWGVRALWRRAGNGRGVARWQALCAYAAAVTLLLALVSPLDALSHRLFSAHMVQHLLLIVVAAPLLALSDPLLPLLWALPPGGRRAAGRRLAAVQRQRAVRAGWHALSHPATVWSLHTVALWVWHAPALFEAALRSDLAHAAEHANFAGTGALNWWVLIHDLRHRRADGPAGVLSLFATGMQSGALGALITFASTPWYGAYAAASAAARLGLSPLENQQLAGLVIWIPAGSLYVAAAAALFLVWMRAEGRRDASQAARPGYAAAASEPA